MGHSELSSTGKKCSTVSCPHRERPTVGSITAVYSQHAQQCGAQVCPKVHYRHSLYDVWVRMLNKKPKTPPVWVGQIHTCLMWAPNGCAHTEPTGVLSFWAPIWDCYWGANYGLPTERSSEAHCRFSLATHPHSSLEVTHSVATQTCFLGSKLT